MCLHSPRRAELLLARQPGTDQPQLHDERQTPPCRRAVHEALRAGIGISEPKCADLTGTHSAGSLRWPFPKL